MNNARFVVQISRGLIRDQRARRTLMFYNMLAVLFLVFIGATFLWSWLRAHPVLFILYWGVCAWLTVLAILLALFDMAKVRLEARRTRRQLEDEYLTHEKTDPPDDSHPS